jgi:hypothetical protein
MQRERCGWRDELISERHRTWGADAPATDVDFLLVEFDRAEPAALVEYKHEAARPCNPNKPVFRALASLATRAGIPCLAVRYRNAFDIFVVHPLNDLARRYVQPGQRMTEREYVGLLYELRGRSLPEHVAVRLNG